MPCPAPPQEHPLHRSTEDSRLKCVPHPKVARRPNPETEYRQRAPTHIATTWRQCREPLTILMSSIGMLNSSSILPKPKTESWIQLIAQLNHPVTTALNQSRGWCYFVDFGSACLSPEKRYRQNTMGGQVTVEPTQDLLESPKSTSCVAGNSW